MIFSSISSLVDPSLLLRRLRDREARDREVRDREARDREVRDREADSCVQPVDCDFSPLLSPPLFVTQVNEKKLQDVCRVRGVVTG